MILSFGWTTPALKALAKTRTRRHWAPRHAESFVRAFHDGKHIDAWNTTPRNTRGNPHKIATIRLTEEPVESNEYPDEDWHREGFAYLSFKGLKVDGQAPEELWAYWRRERPTLWVVSFEVVELAPRGAEA